MPSFKDMQGPAAALGGAFSFAVTAVVAKAVYGDGGSTGFVIALRASAGVLAVGLVMLVLRRRLSLVSRNHGALALYVVGLLGITFGYMGAIAYIPTGLAALIFYIFPITTQISLCVRERRRPSVLTVVAMFGAFAGLTLILGGNADNVAWQGVALALTAAAGATVLFQASPVLLSGNDPLTAAFTGSLVVLPVTFAYGFGVSEMTPPQTPAMWWALALGFLTYACGLVMQLQSVRGGRVGRAAILFNAEPVFVVLMAAAAFGDRLSTQQWLGAAVVIAAIVAVALDDRPRRPVRENSVSPE